jgi:hypothetical protein
MKFDRDSKVVISLLCLMLFASMGFIVEKSLSLRAATKKAEAYRAQIEKVCEVGEQMYFDTFDASLLAIGCVVDLDGNRGNRNVVIYLDLDSRQIGKVVGYGGTVKPYYNRHK